ncbi:pseudouridine-5'-phosphate glycosidase [Aureimonas endophytica]|uniref:Pseudouridine-5'-phosphate glycosidase n=1 Tax=Aureimonas endophytica TaxID=2027858 RepID=A0A916ZE21_9HYPH|nr:pseudouridine-5'-phosphate glycosidase [Aureimonas endophytica]GGD91212.1 pseudouridine-5'-phosphate glycosidase [Aureimonas endophytica]
MSPQPFVPSPAVAEALAQGKPVVALESTIITHGMPWPQNLETATAVEALVRAEGAEPATIAVLEGQLRIGLDAADLERLAQAKDVMKLSRADLAYAVANRRNGSTTVAATMIAAHLAGIAVFATGGIGGVHRGAETSFDISADLDELARTPVIVVSAGAKAILDLPKTLEVLETKGVPVVGFGTDELPAFWSRLSGLKAPLRLDTAEAVAAFQRQRAALGIGGGMLIGNPVPAEAELSRETVSVWIENCLAEAAAQGIAGKAVTPFLLQRMFELSGGRSLETNIALVRNNARVAAGIAKALAAADLADALSAG